MEMKIKERKENPVLNRKEIKFKITHFGEKTPKRSEIKSKIAAEEGLNEELIIINEINTKNGVAESQGYLKVYEDEDSLRNIENDHLIERNLGE